VTAELIVGALGLCVAAGVSPYATIALLGLAHHIGWVPDLPPQLAGVTAPWIITVAVALTVIEFLATLVPGVASAWEAVHAVVRPPIAAALAVLVTWGMDPAPVLLTALTGASVALGTSITKLGARLAIDTSPEPVSNGAASVAELGLVGALVVFVWSHPFIALAAALGIVLTTAIIVRAIWGFIWRNVRRGRRPGVRSIRS
jgi:hypothetical protein